MPTTSTGPASASAARAASITAERHRRGSCEAWPCRIAAGSPALAAASSRPPSSTIVARTPDRPMSRPSARISRDGRAPRAGGRCLRGRRCPTRCGRTRRPPRRLRGRSRPRRRGPPDRPPGRRRPRSRERRACTTSARPAGGSGSDVLITCAPSSAPARAQAAIATGSTESIGMISHTYGMPARSAAPATVAAACRSSSSYDAPTWTYVSTASAPSRRASSTVHASRYGASRYGPTDSVVRSSFRMAFAPRRAARWSRSVPYETISASAPASTTVSISAGRSTRPGWGQE